MALTVLQVAYPFAPVTDDAVGGAEQVLAELDRAVVAAGHRSIVLACDGSRVAGELVGVPRPAGGLEGAVAARHREVYREALERTLARFPVDVVHMHGIDFDSYLPAPGPPLLATLHGPRDWYGERALVPSRPATFLNCVSATQQASFPQGRQFLAPIENGVDVDRLSARHARRDFALSLARVAPEKGIHLALDAARAAGRPLIVAGEVFAYAEHARYFAEEVAPKLDDRRRFVGPLGFTRKRRFLSAARAVLIASLAAETSSLVAREALACGTPVIAFRRGALPEVIEHGVTGFLVEDVREMAAALDEAHRIDPQACRAIVRERFSVATMAARYIALYHRLARSRLERTA